MSTFEPDDSYYDDPPVRRYSGYACPDRMCGAEDCETCHPGNLNETDNDQDQ